MTFTIISLNPQKAGEYKNLDIKVHAHREFEHEASLALDDAAKEYVIQQNHKMGCLQTDIIFTAEMSASHVKWDTMNNGFYAVKSEIQTTENTPTLEDQKVYIYEKYTRPGKVFGIYHKSKMIRIFLLIKDEEPFDVTSLSFLPPLPPLPPSSKENGVEVSSKPTQTSNYESVMSELRQVLEKRQNENTTISTAHNVPFKKLQSFSSAKKKTTKCFRLSESSRVKDHKAEFMQDLEMAISRHSLFDQPPRNAIEENLKVFINPLFGNEVEETQTQEQKQELQEHQELRQQEEQSYSSEEEVFQKVEKSIIRYLRPFKHTPDAHVHHLDQEDVKDEEWGEDKEKDKDEQKDHKEKDKDEEKDDDTKEDDEEKDKDDLHGDDEYSLEEEEYSHEERFQDEEFPHRTSLASDEFEPFDWNMGQSTEKYFEPWNAEPLFPIYSFLDNAAYNFPLYDAYDSTLPLLPNLPEFRPDTHPHYFGADADVTTNASDWLESYQKVVNEWKDALEFRDLPPLIADDTDDISSSDITDTDETEESSFDESIYTDEEDDEYNDYEDDKSSFRMEIPQTPQVTKTPQTIGSVHTPNAPCKKVQSKMHF